MAFAAQVPWEQPWIRLALLRLHAQWWWPSPAGMQQAHGNYDSVRIGLSLPKVLKHPSSEILMPCELIPGVVGWKRASRASNAASNGLSRGTPNVEGSCDWWLQDQAAQQDAFFSCSLKFPSIRNQIQGCLRLWANRWVSTCQSCSRWWTNSMRAPSSATFSLRLLLGMGLEQEQLLVLAATKLVLLHALSAPCACLPLQRQNRPWSWTALQPPLPRCRWMSSSRKSSPTISLHVIWYII